MTTTAATFATGVQLPHRQPTANCAYIHPVARDLTQLRRPQWVTDSRACSCIVGRHSGVHSRKKLIWTMRSRMATNACEHRARLRFPTQFLRDRVGSPQKITISAESHSQAQQHMDDLRLLWLEPSTTSARQRLPSKPTPHFPLCLYPCGRRVCENFPLPCLKTS